MQSSSLAGQQFLSGEQSKRPSLLLTIPQSNETFDLDLESPYNVNTSSLFTTVTPNTATPFSQRTATAISPRTATTTSIFFDWDKVTATESSVDDDDDDDGEAQVITIAPGAPFYHPAPPLGFLTPSFAAVSFGCGALDRSRSVKSPAQVFHEQLAQMIRINDRAIVFDAEEVVGTELLVPTLDMFSAEFGTYSMKKGIYSPPPQAVWRALPDVPDDFEPLDEDVEEMIEDFGDEDYSGDEAVTPLGQSSFTVSFDKCLGAPFGFEANIPNRYSVTTRSRTPHRGLFS